MGESIIYLAQCTMDRGLLYVGKTDRSLPERRGEHEQLAATAESV